MFPITFPKITLKERCSWYRDDSFSFSLFLSLPLFLIFFSYFVDACYVYTQRSSKLSWTRYPVRGRVFEVKSERGKGGWLMHVSGFVPWRREFSVNLQEARHRWEKYGSSVRLSFGGNTSQTASIWIRVFFKDGWNVYHSSVLMFSWNKLNWLNFIFPSMKTWWKKFLQKRNILKYLFQGLFSLLYFLISYEFLMLFNYLDFIPIEMSICFNSFLTLVFIRPNVISEKENLLINEIFWNM